MDIPKIVNQNIGFDMNKLSINSIDRFDYSVKKHTKIYDDEFISKFSTHIQTYLINENKKFEAKPYFPMPFEKGNKTIKK